MTNAAEQRFSDTEWKAKRYDYLLTNDSEAVWQAERELRVMRERVAELEVALEAYGSHDTDCAALTSGHWSREHLPPACNCGLSALLEKNCKEAVEEDPIHQAINRATEGDPGPPRTEGV